MEPTRWSFIASRAVEEQPSSAKGPQDAVFKGLSTGVLAADEFKNISTGKADADDHILYKQATGQLFFDADGGGKGAAVWFATLDNKAAIDHTDFFVV